MLTKTVARGQSEEALMADKPETENGEQSNALSKREVCDDVEKKFTDYRIDSILK